VDVAVSEGRGCMSVSDILFAAIAMFGCYYRSSLII